MNNSTTIVNLSDEYGLPIKYILELFASKGKFIKENTVLSDELVELFKKNFSLLRIKQNIENSKSQIAAEPDAEYKKRETVVPGFEANSEKKKEPVRLRRLLAAAKDFNIGRDTLIDFLLSKGFSKDDLKPTSLLTEEMYEALEKEFQSNKIAYLKSNSIELPKGSIKQKKEEEGILFKKELPRLLAAAKEFNIGADTLINFLRSKGFNLFDLTPISKLSPEMYEALTQEYSSNKDQTLKSDQLDLPKVEGLKIVGKIDLSGIDSGRRPRTIAPILLIRDCLQQKSPYLELGYCNLRDEDFDETSEVYKLLIQCTHLDSLILSNEWTETSYVTQRKEYYKSKNAFNKNRLSKIPRAVKELTRLSRLIISGDSTENGIRITEIENLDSLTRLLYLNISNNQLREIKGLSYLKNLQTLDLSYNLIESINGLKGLHALVRLDLSFNKISEIENLNNLKGLDMLNLEGNIITKIDNLDHFIFLKTLMLQSNRIKSAEGLDKLKLLKRVFLSNNSIEDLSGLEFILDREIDLYIEISDNPFLKEYQLKLEKNENHLPFIKELLIRQSDNSDKSTFAYPVKILILGNHACGKSSMVDYLTGQTNTGSTHILRIENYYLQGRSVKTVLPDAIFYDFGGQDFYHGLYQAFMSKDALQVIIFNSKTDKNEIGNDSHGIPIINFNRRFWLGQKKYQEGTAEDKDPYVVVQSYADEGVNEAKSIDYNYYKGYKRSFFLSLKSPSDVNQWDKEFYETGKQYFKAYFNSLINKLCRTSEEPRWYIQFLKYVINKDSKTFGAVELSDVLKQYKIRDISDEDKLESLRTNLITLHRHGLVLYYPNIPDLRNIVWLHPQGLVEHIQTHILNKAFADTKTNKKTGVVPKKEFESLVNDEKILLLLQEQKVVFLHQPNNNHDDDEYIIPNYLPLIDKEAADFQLFMFGMGKPDFVIKFNDFIPFGFINQMICFFGKEPDVKKFWRNQLLFTLNRQTRILIEMDFEQLKIKVHFQGQQNPGFDKPYLKEYLFFSILALYWNLDHNTIFSYEEFINNKENESDDDVILGIKSRNWKSLQNEPDGIPGDLYISLDDKRFVSYSELFQIAEEVYKVQSYGINENRINVSDTMEIAVGDLEPFTNKKLRKMKKIFVSYSKYDEDYLQDFEDHLVTLKQEGVATFNCRKIEFGKEWDEEIKKQIDECDIMICLISVKFLNTDYITKIEIQKAIEQNKIIVPIIIKSCDWEGSTLGKYQAAQRGRVVSLDNNMKLVGQIKGYTSEERAAFWTDIIKEFRNKLLLP